MNLLFKFPLYVISASQLDIVWGSLPLSERLSHPMELKGIP